MRKSPLVSVIVVNWNRKHLSERVLRLLQQQTFQDFETVFIDNGSTDGSVEYLRPLFPGVRMYPLPRNSGFAVANNIGVKHAVSPWVVLLNNDAFPDPSWLENLLIAAQRYPKFAFFGSRLVQAGKRDLLDGFGDVYHISGLAWRQGYNMPVAVAPTTPREIFSPTAAAALYSRAAWMDVGGFDDNFFMYHEDVDLGFRLRLRGFRCLYVPDAVVYHQGSASTGVKSDFAIYHGHRNLVWTFVKNMPGKLFWKYLPAHLIANIFFVAFYTLKRHPRAIIRAKRDALLGMQRVWQQRQAVQKERLVSEESIDRVLNKEWLAPYLLGLRARHARSVPPCSPSAS